MATKQNRHRPGLLYFVTGVFFGFFLSSFLSSITIVEQSRVRGEHLIAPSKSIEPEDGWSLIHVFFGNDKHLAENSFIPTAYFNQVDWYAQARQDEVVSALLNRKRGGYFVDLAANDAAKISNTLALERNFEWNGLCIEPQPMYWGGLAYRKCHVAAAVIGASNMQEIQFKYPNRAGPSGGIVGSQFDNKHPSEFGEDHPRYTVTLLDVFERFGTPNVIDYLSLDVEGAEEFIMKAFPFERYRFNVLTVERPSEGLKSLLNEHGYMYLKVLKSKSGETLWVHKSQLDSMDKNALDIDTSDYKYRDSDTTIYKSRHSPQPAG